MRIWVNHLLTVAHDIAIEGNVKLFIQVLLDVFVLFSKLQSRICVLMWDLFDRLLLACGPFHMSEASSTF